MVANTTKVSGRRHLRFKSLDAVLADAEELAGGQTKQLGNWTLGQILSHLAAVFEKSIDGTVYRPGGLAHFLGKVLATVVGPLFKRWVLRKGIRLGGASRRDYVDARGQEGRMQREFQVYARAGEPCPRCGRAIVRSVVGGRGTFHCTRCQRAPRK